MTQAAIAHGHSRVSGGVTDVLPGLRNLSLAVALLAGSGLAFQVALTRAFSLMFQYHYVFLVVSLAILGQGLGAAVGYVAAQRISPQGISRAITLSLVGLALLFPATGWALTRVTSSELAVEVVAIPLIPFMFGGWITALIFRRCSEHSGTLYGADLIGAAGGLVVVPLLLMNMGPFGTVAALGVFAGAAAVLATGHWQRQVGFLSAGITLALIVFAALNWQAGLLTYDLREIKDAPPDKTMVHILNDPQQDARVIETAWSSFAQVDVVETSDDSAKFVFTDAGAGSIMLRYDPANNGQDLGWMRSEVAYLPFETAPLDKTLIIGAGAGYDIVMAREAGAEFITAVEINPAIVDITRDYAAYNGDVFDLPGVETVIADGRNFVDRSDETFDLIYLNFVYSQAARPAVSALSENYAFTTEALRSYWGRLSDEGRIAFVTHTGVHGLRLMLTAVDMLTAEGMPVAEALHHMLLVNRPNPADPTITPSVLIIKRAAWTEDEVRALLDVPSMRGMEPQYLAHLWEDYLAPLAEGKLTLAAYIDAYEAHDISPTTDDQPFFYNLERGIPDPLESLAIFSGLLMMAYFVVSAALESQRSAHEWIRIDLLVYFTLLGIGFMLAEVTLLQHFRLLLSDPTTAFAVTVGALLLGGGVGSLLSQRLPFTHMSLGLRAAALGAALWLAFAALAYPAIVDAALPLAPALRALIAVALTLPLGAVLGMLFPSGMRIAGQRDPDGIPVFWGMNAIASTFGGVIASVLALITGFESALFVGALLYFGAAILVQFTGKRVLGL